jgi:hypothetical protein
MINLVKEAVSLELAKVIAAQYLREYHPCGYGTTARITDPVKPGDPWRVHLSRSASCD